ncbi:MAG: serine/threonine protein kinase [Planctomycetales bacterium]|nr:serine/threonine protein kinase [Planctomycetales bacterium]
MNNPTPPSSPSPPDDSNTPGPDDRHVAALISKSLLTDLTSQESSSVAQRLGESPPARSFAKLCRMIQDSVADMADMVAGGTEGDDARQPGLQPEARTRLQNSVAQELARCERLPSAEPAAIADATGDGRSSGPSPDRNDLSQARQSVGGADWDLAARLLELGMVTEAQLESAVEGWDPSRGGLAELLVSRASLDPARLDEAARSHVDLAASVAWRRSAAMMKMNGRFQQEAAQQDPIALARPEASAARRRLVSRFTLLKKLSEGGLGVVWIARDEKLGRLVALKEMHQRANSEVAWSRFRREAAITGHLEHPNVVPVYMFGADPTTGNPFYVMRFVGKRTLADAIAHYHDRRHGGEEDALELHRLLTAFLGACQAIAYAHSRGVIHRDLKPENIALDNFGQVIVLDWGLAKFTHASELGAELSMLSADILAPNDAPANRTVAGEIIGTPLYMAPEQARGALDEVDERTDVYGLGAILFAILAGAAPHQQSIDARGDVGVAEVLKRIADGQAPTPRTLNPHLPLDLEAICLRAMSPKPHARFATASELAERVEGWLAGQRRKQSVYDEMRMEGRELRANIQSAVWDLATNARFMSNLPPIQGLIDVELRPTPEDDDIMVWRERLASIYQGLLGANRDYLSIAFTHFDGASVHERVRVERHSSDPSITRIVPRSRLMSYDATDFARQVMLQNPGETCFTMSQDCRCPDSSCDMRLVAGVPIYDARSEEPFGFVTIECDLRRVLQRQAGDRRSDAYELLIVAPSGVIVLHYAPNTSDNCVGLPFAESHPQHAARVADTLARRVELVDESDRELYATRTDLSVQSRIQLVFLRR